MRTSLFLFSLLSLFSSQAYAFDLYAINDVDAKIYVYGAAVANKLYDSTAWTAIVVSVSVFAFMRHFPESFRNAVNPVAGALKPIALVVAAGIFLLWPVESNLNVYRISKADSLQNIVKWLIPSDVDSSIVFEDSYLSVQTKLPFFVVLSGFFISNLQAWLITVVDSAASTFNDYLSVTNGAFLYEAKMSTLLTKVSKGLDLVVADLNEEGVLTQEDLDRYAIAIQSLECFFKKKCVSRSYLNAVFQQNVAEATDSNLSFKFVDTPVAISALADHIDPRLSALDKSYCQDWARTAAENLRDICQKWADAKNEVPEICYGLADISTWQQMKNAFSAARDFVINLPTRAWDLTSEAVNELLKNFLLAGVGIANIVFLEIVLTAAPVLLGVINMILTFFSPLAFAFILLHSNIVESTARFLLELAWARLLYVVFVLAHVLAAAIQGPLWQAVVGAGAGAVYSNKQLLKAFVTKLGIGMFGTGVIMGLFAHTVITTIVALVTLSVGAQLLRTVIIGEGMHLINMITPSKNLKK